ncbi:MAG: PASTA domain-containing protein [Tidjanibacter sp.]|nr:PASTA domain-containing protein [Tidjanibacter sp.]
MATKPTPKKSSQRNKKAETNKERSVVGSLFRNCVLAVSLLIIALFVTNITLSIFTRHGQNKDVPNFIGEHIEEAHLVAQKGRLEIVVNDSLYVPLYPGGVVLEQRPSAGKDKVKSGRKIYVTINASRQRSVEVPFVAGYSLRQAKSNLLTAGLEIDHLEYVEDLASNYVLSQNLHGVEITPDTTIMAPLGSKITLVVGGNRSERISVPDLTGMTLREVKSTLWDLGLNLGTVEFDAVLDMAGQNSAKVFIQSPEPEEEVRQGRKISVILSTEDKTISSPTEEEVVVKSEE